MTTTTMTDGQTDYFTPCACTWGNNMGMKADGECYVARHSPAWSSIAPVAILHEDVQLNEHTFNKSNYSTP